MANNPNQLVKEWELDTGKDPSKVATPKAGVHVRDWVKKNYPDEYQLDRIKYPFTFEELKKAWDEDADNDFYKVASTDGSGFDSAVREEIFNGFVENLGGDYDDYYYKWLGADRPDSLYNKLRKPSSPDYESKFKAKYPDRYDAFKKHPIVSDLTDEEIDEIARSFGVEID